MITVEQLLMTAREEGASDVHITVGVPPRMRVNGRIANLDYPSLSETDCSKIIYSIMDDRQIEMFRDNKQIEFALSVPKAGRYRVSAFMQKGLPACAIRLVTDSVSAPGDIGVPKELIDICDSESGLVILGGVAGSGKSTTIASIIDYINENKCVHILTLEDPIEYVHTHKNAIVNQREVGIDVASYDEGLKLAIREDVDVIQVGARNMQNFELLKELGKINKPILLKRGMSSTIDELLMSAEYIMAGGNEQVILCERGIRTFETSMRNTLDISAVPMLNLPVIVDPSHAAGIRFMVEPLTMAAIAAGADGVMIEVHNNPEKALCDGMQSLTPQAFDDVMKKVKKTTEFFGKVM